MRFVLLGPPGAGKGTQAKIMEKEGGMVHISTGDLFRANIKQETELGKQVKVYLDSGRYVPDSLTIALVWDRLDQEDCQAGYILDGFPRTIAQAEALDAGLAERGLALDGAIAFSVPKEVLVPRLAGRRVCPDCGASYHIKDHPPKETGRCDLCGGTLVQRKDDEEATIAHRIEVYDQATAPLLAYYEKQGKLIKIDGNQSMERVAEDVRQVLKKK